MAEGEDVRVTTEDAFRYCINEHFGRANVVRVELCGAKFACWCAQGRYVWALEDIERAKR